MDSAFDLQSHGFDSVEDLGEVELESSGIVDATVSTKEPAPPVHGTNPDFYDNNGNGPWDNTVYGGDPYASTTPKDPPLRGGGPKQ